MLSYNEAASLVSRLNSLEAQINSSIGTAVSPVPFGAGQFSMAAFDARQSQLLARINNSFAGGSINNDQHEMLKEQLASIAREGARLRSGAGDAQSLASLQRSQDALDRSISREVQLSARPGRHWY